MPKKTKKEARLKRSLPTRSKIRSLGVARLCIFRTPRHIYAQVIQLTGAQNTTSVVVASASTLDKDIKSQAANGGNKDAAILVGKTVAKRAKDAGIAKVAFDRSGFAYHGRIKALADAARESGLDF
jgi:large subunit ribosomal protein L18